MNESSRPVIIASSTIFRKHLVKLTFLFCFTSCWQTWAQSSIVHLSADSLVGMTNSLSLQQYAWKFRSGDRPEWSSTGFQDSEWAGIRSVFGRESLPKTWNGIGWFRISLVADSTLNGQTLAFRINHDGASEIYIDGIKKGGYGRIGLNAKETVAERAPGLLIPFDVYTGDTVFIAIRYANYAPPFPDFVGFESYVGNYRTLSATLRSASYTSRNQMISFGALSAFAVLHLLLFIFYPKEKVNLYYALFVASAAGTLVFRYLYSETSVPDLQLLGSIGFTISKTLATIFGGLLLYKIANAKISGVRLALVLIPGCFYLFYYCFFPFSRSNSFFDLYFLVLISDGLWLLWKEFRAGRKGVWLIWTGMFITALFFFFVGTDVFHIWVNRNGEADALMAIGLLAMPLCFSIFLALDFARTNKDLSLRLIEIEKLSSENLRAEKDKRQLIERQAENLEKTVKERTAEVQYQADKLRELDTFKSRFFINLTHEFRTPLTLILGPAERLFNQNKDPKTRSDTNLIIKSAKRLLKMINELLDLSKLEAGKIEVNSSPQELIGLIRNICNSFDTLAIGKQITLQFSTNIDKCAANVDRPKFENIFYNLVSNAFKFTPTGGTISVDAALFNAHNESLLHVQVRDTGIGISPKKLPLIFDRFFQADSSDSRPQEGTGIGLALTKELIELLNGSIQVESEEGAGTTVSVKLPVEMLPDQQLAEPAIIPVPADPVQWEMKETGIPFLQSADSNLVLIIEDNADLRSFIRSSLSGNYRIMEAENGEEGITLALENIPDLIITDLMMPGKDGYQVCAAIKSNEKTSHIPVIILTAKVDVASRITGLQTGADAYLRKPFYEPELIAQIENLIGMRQALRQSLREKYSSDNSWLAQTEELPSMEQAFLGKVRLALEAHLSDETYSAELLASDVGLSRTQFHRKLKALINQTPGDLIRTVRMDKAKELLQKNAGTVAEVGYMVGYGNPANFSTSFARHFGFPPSEVLKK
ncbi:ATP-binding protein [Dyadobacter sp. CY323]|uniref:ATP-binding protein n=1 Tax=Dyadobacter sp. CY323 TaxID=2907302 RepID=UPI001F303F8E|nr:ATP-binding protein [Dyadobacter sp. CY323]MCE6988104.1 ATP-binding protein [Dyadobacter sp. CY323]